MRYPSNRRHGRTLSPDLTRVSWSFLLTLLAGTASATVTTLYDDTNGLPASQGSFFYCEDPTCTADDPNATETSVPQGVTLTTTSGVSAGYTNTVFGSTLGPIMNQTAGYAITFELKINSESHSNNDRAGFSVTALSSDNLGIELGFWTDRIWAQSGNAFTQAEGVPFDTSSAENRYELRIENGSYGLYSGGTQLLTGPLRDYQATCNPIIDGARFVYCFPNFLFFGDNTSSAGGDITLGTITFNDDLSTPQQIPIPFAALGVAFLLLSVVATKNHPYHGQP